LASHPEFSPLQEPARRAGQPDEDGEQGERWRPTPLAALGLAEIPTDVHFLRDHFGPPAMDPGAWKLTLNGSDRSLAFDLATLRELPARTVSAVLECAGHRRLEFDPIPPGVGWGVGALAQASWTGVSLAAVIELAGVPRGAQEVVLEGADAGSVEGFDGIHHFARGLPLAKALDADVLLAFEMNGAPISVDHGGPVRAVVPGWYATDSVKWLERIWFTDSEFDGVFQAHDYRLRVPGEAGLGERMTELPVHALITAPADGETLAPGETSISGIAWGGTGAVAEVLVRVDVGPWTTARVAPPADRYGRSRWELRYPLSSGPHQLACCARDESNNSQPERPLKNVDGYANNAIHRIRVTVG
jgi:DMSO/TMAO reductase YedYZ molybdopterin-dependent catalytic subunit